MHTHVLSHFEQHDLILFETSQKVLEKFGPLVLTPRTTYFYDLAESIISQQLSIKAADTIFKRVLQLLPNQEVTPENLLALTEEQLRSCGVSGAKARYMHDLAYKVAAQEIHLHKLQEMTNEEVIAELIKIKGIGNWTAEMFLMFSLGREDVFSFGDGGLQRGIKNLYNLDVKTDRPKIEKIVAKWSPYRTYASRVLWKSLDLG